jgi:hypothetical protein
MGTGRKPIAPWARSRDRAPRAAPDIACVGHPPSPRVPDTLSLSDFRSRRSLHDEVDPDQWLLVMARDSPRQLCLVEQRSRGRAGRLVDRLPSVVVVAALVMVAVTVHW